MSLAHRIHDHFHKPGATDHGAADHSAADHRAVDHGAADHKGSHHDGSPFWVRHYDGLARFVSFGRVDKLHRGTLELVGLQPNQALLDVGCGTGELVLAAEVMVGGRGTFVGIDSEIGMVAQASRKGSERRSDAVFVEAGIEAVPYPDESFDVITSSLMFHHLSPPQQSDGLTEMFRLLKPGGTLIVVDINSAQPSLISRLPGHRDPTATDTVQENLPGQLRDAGYVEVSAGAHPLAAMSFVLGDKP